MPKNKDAKHIDLFCFYGRNLTLLQCSLLTAILATAGLNIVYKNIKGSVENGKCWNSG